MTKTLAGASPVDQPVRPREVPLPGGFGRALRDGSILPSGQPKIMGPSLEQWLAESRR